MPPLLSLDHVSKTFPTGTAALSDITLDIADGTFVSLLGPSGCGKSTLLRLVAGLDSPTSGTIVWPAFAAAGERGRPDIGFVFQEPTLMPWASVYDNIRLPLRLKRISRSGGDAAVREAIERVGLADFAAAAPRELSGGMKMRVSIARALVTRPRVLLLDEPFASLDEITRQRLNNDLIELWRDGGFTVVFVTHSVHESVFLSGRIVVLAARPGRIAADLAVDVAAPRDRAFRLSPAYAEFCRRASDALVTAMEMGEADPGDAPGASG
ncbi:MAG: ABC transporter ATP-binding protein [Ancalomicrobiaceae bacterium]|nr:ABC transporter ATP-binding protein [Ancalomicrobiaceae bacterium]